MNRLIYTGALLVCLSPGVAHADPAPDPTTLETLNSPMTSHDGSWFGQLYDSGLGYEDPVVTSPDGTPQAGTFRRLTNEDLDALAGSIVLWQPSEPLPAGDYVVTFESQTGSLQVDPELSIEVLLNDAVADAEYLTTRDGVAAGGTSCCTVEGCGGDSCVDCWPTYNFLSATASLPLPSFPNSIALRVQRGSDAEALVLLQVPQVTAYSGFDVDELCIGVDVVDANFTTLQSEERCAGIDAPSEELVREQPVPDTCIDDPCIRIASEVEPEAAEDCGDDLGAQPPMSPDPVSGDDGAKSSPGCGCGSGGASSPSLVLLALGLIGLRTRRRRSRRA